MKVQSTYTSAHTPEHKVPKARVSGIERFQHVITILYTRNKPPSWCTTCYSMLLAVYAISIKNPQVNVYMVVLAYIAMVFCPIQHILEALYVHEDRHKSSGQSRCTPTWQLFSVFLRNLEDDDVT